MFGFYRFGWDWRLCRIPELCVAGGDEMKNNNKLLFPDYVIKK